MICSLCKTPFKVSHKVDPLYYDCPGCKAMVKDKAFHLSPEEEEEVYLQHNNDVNDQRYQKFTSPITNFILKRFSPEHQGLDFGSGTGPVITKVLKDQQYQIETYDPFFAPKRELLDKQYDYIACCEVMEHFYHPRKEFERISQLLKPGGMFIAMTLIYNDSFDFSSWPYKKDPTHVFIYRAETIRYIAGKFNFSVELIGKRILVLRKEG